MSNLTPATSPTDYPHLFSPMRLRTLTLRNRIVNLPQGMGYTNRGQVEEEDVEYHRRRAAGGVGLLITGGTAIHGSSQTRTRNFIEAYDRSVIDGVRRRSEAIHGQGAYIVGQLFNLGREMAADAMTDVPLAPSALRVGGVAYAPMQMGREEIDKVIVGFCVSARNFAEAGCDGVEIHGAHGYLLAQFLSPASNQRDDEYGGDAKRRARLLIETVRAVRQSVAPDFVVGVRLSVDDETAGGTDPSQCRETIDYLREAVDVDYLSLSVGIKGTYVQDSSAADGVALERIRAVSTGQTIPVIASQRIRRPEQAEQLIADGTADLVGMARALIADPQWALKAQRGQADRIRLCVGDLQDCRSHLSGGLRCMINPEVGHELDSARLRVGHLPRPSQRSITVVGAGPAGLEFARRVAERGDLVTLIEAGPEVGGQLVAAARAPGRAELLDFVQYQRAELRRLGVSVELDTRVDDLSDIDADVVVVATGASGAPRPSGLVMGPVRSVWDVVHSVPVAIDGPVTVIDDGTGSWPMLTAAQLLAVHAESVTIVTAAGSVTAGVPAESVAGVRRRLRTAGIRWMVDASYAGYADGAASFRIGGTGDELRLATDLIVIEAGRVPVDQLWRDGRSSGAAVHAIGDTLTPRTVGNAVRDAMTLERRLAVQSSRWAS